MGRGVEKGVETKKGGVERKEKEVEASPEHMERWRGEWEEKGQRGKRVRR